MFLIYRFSHLPGCRSFHAVDSLFIPCFIFSGMEKFPMDLAARFQWPSESPLGTTEGNSKGRGSLLSPFGLVSTPDWLPMDFHQSIAGWKLTN